MIRTRDFQRLIRAWALAIILVSIISERVLSQELREKPEAQAISQTGLLPVYAVDLSLDQGWVDGSQFPSPGSPVFQSVWDSLRPGGFNTLRIPVDVRDGRVAAIRVANLCVWATNNNVRLVPVLIGGDRVRTLGSDYSGSVFSFIQSLLSRLRAAGSSQLEAYTQILGYQLETEMNHPGLNVGIAADTAQLWLVS